MLKKFTKERIAYGDLIGTLVFNPQKEIFLCPVCGFPYEGGGAAPWLITNSLNNKYKIYEASPSYNICLSCNCEFGVDDVAGDSLDEEWKYLRYKFLQKVNVDKTLVKELALIGVEVNPDQFLFFNKSHFGSNYKLLKLKRPDKELVNIRLTDDDKPICPVCGKISEVICKPPYEPDCNNKLGNLPLASSTGYSCECCGVSFGKDDIELQHYTQDLKTGNYPTWTPKIVGKKTKVTQEYHRTLEQSWESLRIKWLKKVNLNEVREQLKNIDVFV